MPRLARFRTLPMLILLIGLQCLGQLAAIGHGASHLAESLAERSATGNKTGGNNLPAPGTSHAAHACGLCLLAHDLAQGLPSQPLLAGHGVQGIDGALPPLSGTWGTRPLAPRQRGPPSLS